MFTLEPTTFINFVITALFFAGLGILITGVIYLLKKGPGGDIKVLAQQTAKLAQKGIAEDIAGLVGNVSSLVDALNRLAATSTGIGVFLIIVGGILIWMAYAIFRETVGL